MASWSPPRAPLPLMRGRLLFLEEDLIHSISGLEDQVGRPAAGGFFSSLNYTWGPISSFPTLPVGDESGCLS